MKSFKMFFCIAMVSVIAILFTGCVSPYQIEKTTTTYSDGRVVVVEKTIPTNNLYYSTPYTSYSYYPYYYPNYYSPYNRSYNIGYGGYNIGYSSPRINYNGDTNRGYMGRSGSGRRR